MQNYLTDILPNRSLGLCLLQHYQENSPGHTARVSQQSQPGFGSVMNAVCLKTKRGNFTSACLVTESPVQPVLSQEGAPWDLQGAWFSAPNHCLTRLQCSHSRATHFHLCWLSQVLHIPMHRVSGAPGRLQEGEPPACPSKELHPRALASHASWTTSAKHSATTCALLSPDQLAADPCLVLPFL